MNYFKNFGNRNFFGILRLTFIITILLIISSLNVNAVSISVTKAYLNYNNVLQGGYAEDILYVSTDAGFDIPLIYELSGDIASWINITPDLNNPDAPVTISNDGYLTLRISISPPSDIPLGTYNGSVRLITGTLNSDSSQYGSQLQAAFLIKLSVEVVGTQFLQCSGSGVVLKDSEIGSPIDYSMTVSNSGNIRVRPTATIDIWNQDQTKLVATKEISFNSKEIFPTTSEVLFNKFSNDLRIGQYWAYVTINPCANSQLTTFNIYEKGAIIDSGEFLRLDNYPWASVDEVVPITATFMNTGSRTVSAKFKGVVTFNNKIIDTIDSEYYDVAPGATENIVVYYTPKKYGQYVITGQILYNNKLTFEKSTVINVNTGEESNSTWIYVIIILIIVILILLLLIIIKKKRRELHHHKGF